MKNKNVLVIMAIAIGVAIFYWKDRHAERDFPDVNEHIDRPAVRAKAQLGINSSETSQEVKNDKPVSTDSTASANESVEIQKNFATYLRQLGQCFGISTLVEQESIKPEYDQILKSLSSSLGDVLVRLDDWSQLDLQMNDGTKQRIRKEIDYLENNTPSSRIQLFLLNEDNMPELQALKPEQAALDSEELADSIMSQGRTLILDKGLRSYFSEGEELSLVERNGKVQSFSFTKGERTFNCSDTDQINSRCQCL